jgi:CCR4-NOT transcription complex subunit 7/8
VAWCREFKLSDDMFAQDSIELLKQSGIDFSVNESRGINVHDFGELLMSSGIVLNEDVRDQPTSFFLATLHASLSSGHNDKLITLAVLDTQGSMDNVPQRL